MNPCQSVTTVVSMFYKSIEEIKFWQSRDHQVVSVVVRFARWNNRLFSPVKWGFYELCTPSSFGVLRIWVTSFKMTRSLRAERSMDCRWSFSSKLSFIWNVFIVAFIYSHSRFRHIICSAALHDHQDATIQHLNELSSLSMEAIPPSLRRSVRYGIEPGIPHYHCPVHHFRPYSNIFHSPCRPTDRIKTVYLLFNWDGLIVILMSSSKITADYICCLSRSPIGAL